MHLAAVPADSPAVSASAELSALLTRTARGDEQAFAALYDSVAGRGASGIAVWPRSPYIHKGKDLGLP